MTFTLNFADHSPALIIFLLAWAGTWLSAIVTILIRKDFDPITRLTWVIVVIFVPIFGILFYAWLAPVLLSKRKATSLHSLSGTPWEHNPGHTIKSGSHQT